MEETPAEVEPEPAKVTDVSVTIKEIKEHDPLVEVLGRANRPKKCPKCVLTEKAAMEPSPLTF